MNILQINTVFGTGSTGRIVTDLNAILTSLNHHGSVAYGRGLCNNSTNAIRIGRDLDNYTHGIYTRFFDLHGFGSMVATKKFISWIDHLNPDLIHLHNLHGYYINIVELFNYLKAVDKPVVWTLHDCWAFTGHCSHFDYCGCDKWIHGCFECPQLSEYPKSFFYDRSKKNYIRKKSIFNGLNNLSIVTPSQWLASLVKKSFLTNYPLEVINNGIDLGIFQPKHSDFRKIHNLSEKFVILGVASPWRERKGLRTILKLAENLRPDENLVVVGVNSDQKKSLPPGVIGISRTDSAIQLSEIYSSADVFINPSLEENFPTTNLESLACGTPVITYDSGGSPETIDKNCGLIVPKNDLDMLRLAIDEIKKKNKFHYSQACRERAIRLYDKYPRYKDYIELYKRSLRELIL